MFVDKIRIFIQAGKGGDGRLSFRREKYVPYGGPNGGNGGLGGSVYMVADPNKNTLLDLTYRPHYKAEEGSPGQPWDRAGRAGEDLLIRVPVGTVVKRGEEVVGDLKEPGERLLVAQGGRGGRGNAAFKTTRVTAPKIAEKGEPGESFDTDLELKLIADVGFVGCPNAGKSTLLSRISAATPKIADYPFTTLSPNLGVVQFQDKTFVAADIPGLIEGAHLGKGLGMEFLRHVERTRLLIHLIDPLGFDRKTPLQSVRAIEQELKRYSAKLAKKPVIYVLNKMDLTGADQVRKKLQKLLKGKKLFAISAVSGAGISKLVEEVVSRLSKVKEEREEKAVIADFKKFVFENEFWVEREDDGFRVKGKKVERLVSMTNFDQEQAVSRMQNILKKMGVEKMLMKEGIQPGDKIHIGVMEFLFKESSFEGAAERV